MGIKLGKRGFRVYPPWDKPHQQKQLKKPKNGQLEYFVNIDTKFKRT